MGLIQFSFSAAAEKEIVSNASEESNNIGLSYDTKLKSITVNDTTKTYELLAEHFSSLFWLVAPPP